MSEYTPTMYQAQDSYVNGSMSKGRYEGNRARRRSEYRAEFHRWLAKERAAARREGQAEALRQAAYEFAEGAWQDQWSADEVECDVTAVQSTYRWFVAKANQIENGSDQ